MLPIRLIYKRKNMKLDHSFLIT